MVVISSLVCVCVRERERVCVCVCVCMVRTHTIYPFSKFQVYNVILLAIVATPVYIKSPELAHLT